MSRYIDADAFREYLGNIRAEYNFFTDEERPRYEAYSKALLILNEYVENEPTIGIVRCKECKSYDTEAYQNGYGYCSNHMSVLEDNDFCSRGEREGE